MLHVDSGDWSGRKALTFPGTDTPDTEQSPHSLISTECRLSARPIAPKGYSKWLWVRQFALGHVSISYTFRAWVSDRVSE